MSAGEFEETRNLWNRLVDDWRIQVGYEGDSNRAFSTPIPFCGSLQMMSADSRFSLPGAVLDIYPRNSAIAAIAARELTSPHERLRLPVRSISISTSASILALN